VRDGKGCTNEARRKETDFPPTILQILSSNDELSAKKNK
jgi:hypothetical protein